jgi:hypothetical protein
LFLEIVLFHGYDYFFCCFWSFPVKAHKGKIFKIYFFLSFSYENHFMEWTFHKFLLVIYSFLKFLLWWSLWFFFVIFSYQGRTFMHDCLNLILSHIFERYQAHTFKIYKRCVFLSRAKIIQSWKYLLVQFIFEI